MSTEIVKGRRAIIYFDAERCVHSRGCVLSHPDVFVPNVVGDWIHPDAQGNAALLHVAKNCPSGAIRVVATNADGASVSSDEAPLVNTMRLRENGPLAIEAEWRLDGKPQDSPRATLCRCGMSKNKPYCDGSHAAGFVATGEPATGEWSGLTKRNGPVDVQPIANGPLLVTGSLELVSGTGRTINQVHEVYLCRCGQSRSKPYCDGSHRSAGFVAE